MSNYFSNWRPVLGFTAATLILAVVLGAAVAWRSGHLEADQVGLITAYDEALSAPPEGQGQPGGRPGAGGRPGPRDTPDFEPGQGPGLAPGEEAPPIGPEIENGSLAEKLPPEVAHSDRLMTLSGLTSHLGAELNRTRQISLAAIGAFFVLGVAVLGYQTVRRRKVERQVLAAQRFEHMGVMAAGTAHDFNNILTVINGNAALIRMGIEDDSPMQDYIREVEAAVERAAQLTQQLQAYAGTGSGPFAPIDVNAVVADSTNMMQVLVPEGVSLTIALADSLTPTQADAGQLQQVLMNLLKNALDAIGADGGTILVQTEEISMPRKFPDAYVIENNARPGRYVAITVKDSGSGIPKSELENIFNPYSSSKGMGRGLGLASVAGIVRSHGGAVAVRSSKDEGTEFTVLLPLAEDDRAAADERVRRDTDAGLTRGPAAPAK